jgi:hypothetical protein
MGKNSLLCYEVVDLVNYKFMFVEHEFCRDTEKEAKKLKRSSKR